MPICITCSTPVKELYTVYSKADDRTLGKGVRLTQCPNCKRFADKYVEHDFVVLFIDLVLIKPQIYRHLLFNRLGRSDDKFDPSILRLGTLLVLFDVYITWARVEKSNAGIGGGRVVHSRLSDMPILAQYFFFLTMNILATIAQHGIIRLLTRVLVPDRSRQSQVHDAAPPTPASTTTAEARPTLATSHANPSAISTALLVSSCTKLFPILLVIWPTEANEGDPFGFAFRATNYVGWAVLLNNIEALLILLDCGYVIATALAVSGFIARWMVEGWFLSFVGSARDTGPVGDLLAAYSFVRAWLGQG
ncbi:ARV1-like protein [Cladophialophora carrionii]|uniref:Protein ARV n=1 Tax=Cladophialophora carrionii TaxID=86049 RepID=A0A1C1CSI3_9EURO|nr:ARV1-like protein [Cladophialophora carrionii]